MKTYQFLATMSLPRGLRIFFLWCGRTVALDDRLLRFWSSLPILPVEDVAEDFEDYSAFDNFLLAA
jgi:hypothetical protein